MFYKHMKFRNQARLCLAISDFEARIMLRFMLRFRSAFICQGTSTRRQRSNLCDLRVKLPPVTTSL